jgi:hypothetical protein
MNKTITAAGSAAAALLLLAVSDRARAQTSPVPDARTVIVAADHWAYEELARLESPTPRISENDDNGRRGMTRQELAGHTKRALGKLLSRSVGSDRNDLQQRRADVARMERLVAEFAPELSAQGLDVPRTLIRLATVAAQNAEPSSDDPSVRPVGPVSPPFRDVPTDHWAYESVERLRRLGIIGGYPGGGARPQQTAPARQQRSQQRQQQ